jgi:hypothetical protein
MFPRFRQTDYRLQVSLVETRRTAGKVRHEHVAGLGSVEWPPSVEDRIAFWQRLHERLAKLSNRVDATAQAKILGAIHARIPMVTLDEQRALQLENAKSDERWWETIHNMHAGTVDDHMALAGTVERKVAEAQAGMVDTAAKREAAKVRRERLERGEDVPGGIGKPFMREDMERILREAGIDPQHCYDVGELSDLMGVDAMCEALRPAGVGAMERAHRTIIRRLLRKHRQQRPSAITDVVHGGK